MKLQRSLWAILLILIVPGCGGNTTGVAVHSTRHVDSSQLHIKDHHNGKTDQEADRRLIHIAMSVRFGDQTLQPRQHPSLLKRNSGRMAGLARPSRPLRHR